MTARSVGRTDEDLAMKSIFTASGHGFKPGDFVTLSGLGGRAAKFCTTVEIVTADAFTYRDGWWRRNRIKSGRRYLRQRYERRIK